MALQIEDILSAICTEYKLSAANDYQKIYVLSTDMEAKLAYDVLIALGFNVKVYHTPDKPSKLYITTQEISAEQLEQRFASALLYVRTLKGIKGNLDELCRAPGPNDKPNTFTMAFVNAQPQGKQILIQLSQTTGDTVSSVVSSSSAPAAGTNSSAPAAIAAKVASGPVSASSKRVPKKRKGPKEQDGLAAGPAVGRGLYPGKKEAEEVGKQLPLKKRIMIFFAGNFATSGYAAILWLTLVGVLFSCFVFAKSFLCYDFVAKKSTAWYCKDPNQMAAEEAAKAEKEKKQKALGLAPVDNPP